MAAIVNIVTACVKQMKRMRIFIGYAVCPERAGWLE
jgi:hypothetical protein